MKLTKTDTVRAMASANTVTMTNYELRDDKSGEFVSAGGRLIGVPRKVTRVQTNGLYLDDSFLDINRSTYFELMPTGTIVAHFRDLNGIVWARANYELN